MPSGKKRQRLSSELQRVIDLGMIDYWLRGLCQLVPRPTTDTAVLKGEFNTHMIGYETGAAITARRLHDLVGCRSLLSACKDINVAVDMNLRDNGYLMISFKPTHPFDSSVIFGKSYRNVIPAPQRKEKAYIAIT